MAIPELDTEGLLPPGLYDCTFAELEARFGDPGARGRRPFLLARLRRYFDELRETGLVDHVILAGSFVTAKDEPGDIDLLVVLKAGALEPEQPGDVGYYVLSRLQAGARYEFDVLTAHRDSLVYDDHLRFFQRVRGSQRTDKGLVRITL